jgi:rsbT antagonist protein RsbS
MALYADIPRVAMQVSRGVVVVSIQVDLRDEVLTQLPEDLLRCIQETGARAVILDASGLEILDSAELAALRRIITMTDLMGAMSVLVGLRPGVVSALIEANADVEGLSAAIDLDAAFDLLEPELEAEPEAQLDIEPTSDAEAVQDGGQPSPPDAALEVGR